MPPSRSRCLTGSIRARADTAPDAIGDTVNPTEAEDRLYGPRERFAFALGAVVLGAVVCASLWLSIRLVRDLQQAARSQEIRAQTIELLEQVTSAETGQRGFLLTGKDSYLQSFRRAKQALPRMTAAIGPELADDPDFRPLRAAIEDKLGELERTIELAKAGRHDEALAIVQSDFGERRMQDVRTLVARIAERERGVLVHDIAASGRGAAFVAAVDAVAFVLLVLLAGVIANGARRSVRQLRRAQEAQQLAYTELAAGRERLEQTVQARTAELRRANEEIQRFAYIVSHDLRAPLLNIIGFTSELKNATGRLHEFVELNLAREGGELPAEVREACEADLPEAIRFIEASTAKMDRLIRAILQLSREGRRVLVPERLDMATLLDGIADTVRHQAAESGAELVIGRTPPLVSDRWAMEQIFSNLLENAIKYLNPSRPGRISIDGVREGTLVVYSVRDNGRGIAGRDLERIFELFRRAGPQDVPGEGIGLAHVRALARRLGGTIECSSELGVGSCFSLRLPAVPGPMENVPG